MPDLLFIADQSPDHPVMLSLVSQLLECGVDFTTDGREGFLRELPASLANFKAILFDAPGFKRVTADAGARARLEQFIREGKYVLGLEEVKSGDQDSLQMPLMIKMSLDMMTSNCVYDSILHGGLSRFSPAFLAARRSTSDASVLAALKDFVLRGITKRRIWDEFTLHYWKPAQALANAGHEDVKAALLTAVRESLPKLPVPFHHDQLAGFFAVPWYCDQTGEKEPLQRMRAIMDDVLARRPREMGVAVGAGFSDDPLGTRDGHFSPSLVSATVRSGVIWTEVLHFHGPTLASLARATGDRKYLDEAMRMVDHVAKYHLQPAGILAHCSKAGKPATSSWGRGQTHALYGMRYMLDEMEPGTPEFQRIIGLVTKIGRGLVKYQDATSGLWRNVIDHPDARLESTSTCGITCLFAKCLRKGWLPRSEFEPMVRKAWDGLKIMLWRGGLAAGCRGTAAATDVSYYLARPQGWTVVPQVTMAALDLRG